MKVPQNNVYNYNQPAFLGYAEAQQYAKRTRLYNRFFNKKLYYCNLKKLEGIQEGLKTFEGLSMKQIAFALTDLHSINMIRGCLNHCLHCYANAQPFITRSLFENLKQITDDIAALRKRLGFNPVSHRGDKYIDCYFDADGLDMHLFDRNGNKHDAIEISKIMHKSTGMKSVFDTNGWDRNNKERQAIAEDYVKKLSLRENSKHFFQINLSLNPFNPKYIKALKDGYDPKRYSPLIPIDDCINTKPNNPNLQKAENNYREYIKNEANMLFTFTPLLLKNKLGTIIRGLDNNITNMEGCRIEDYIVTLQNILQNLQWLYIADYQGEQKVIKSQRMIDKALKKYAKLFSNCNTNLFSSGRMESFYRVKHKGSLEGIENIDNMRERAENNYKNLKSTSKISSTDLMYLKMINSDGKVYLYDNYSIIPTDIQLKTDEKPLKTPFWVKIRDFVVKTDMIDMI